MNLLHIVYSSLLVFSVFVVLLISVSFIIYKLKGNKIEHSNSDSTFVLRRPVTFATASNNIIYQKSSSKNNNFKDSSKSSFGNEARDFQNDSGSAKINDNISFRRNPYNQVKKSRYQILSNSPDGNSSNGSGFVNYRPERNSIGLNYYNETLSSNPFHINNQSKLF